METKFWDRAVCVLRGGRLSTGVPDRTAKWAARWAGRVGRSDRGMTTSEYAVGTMVICSCQVSLQVTAQQRWMAHEARSAPAPGVRSGPG